MTENTSEWFCLGQSCQREVNRARNASGARVYRKCFADVPGHWAAPETYVDGYGLTKTRRRGRATRPRNWEADPAALDAAATAAGLEVEALLCRGCNNKRDRLIAEGGWSA